MILATGTGSCGTTWFADCLVAAGVNATHEHVYLPDGRTLPDWSTHTPDVDVSLYGAPYAATHEGPVVHLVRHPLDCIASLYRRGFLDPGRHYGAWFIMDQWQYAPNTVEGCASYWVGWNLLCERATDYQRHRVEDLGTVDALSEPVSLEDMTPQTGAAVAALAERYGYAL